MIISYLNLVFHRIKNHFSHPKNPVKIYPDNNKLKISKPNYLVNINIVYPPLTPIEESPINKSPTNTPIKKIK